MKKVSAKKIYLIALAVILASGIVFSFYANSLPKTNCGFQSCHGLDLSCGAQIQCELVYQYGDNCRQYAKCYFEGNGLTGSCFLNKSSRFDECKSCVQKCLQDFGDDYIKSFECEYKCTL